MFFHRAIVATFLATSSVFAAPLAARNQEAFYPSATWAYDVGTGAIASTNVGLAAKHPSNDGHDVTALLTFTYPNIAKGLKCRFAFSLAPGDTLDGSGKLDLFSSLSPAPGPRDSWGPGNQRNIHLGRLSAAIGAEATWDATYSTYLTEKTDCKEPGTVEAFELVGVYDYDVVSWAEGASGLRIVLSD